MFTSATLKLTGWYLLILMSISFVFSVAIYNITSSELRDRLSQLQTLFELADDSQSLNELHPQDPRYTTFRDDQRARADRNILLALVYVNGLIFVIGGTGSYILARRTLRNIEEVHEAQSRFTSDASHELRTPLAAMKAELEVALRDKNLSSKDMRAVLTSNLEEVDKLTRLSHMLLQLSKAEYSQLERTAVDLEAIIAATVHRHDKTGKRLQLNTAQDLPLVDANLASMEELTTILIDNALLYSPKSSLVTVDLTKKSSRLSMQISNAGEGIASEDLPRIFDRFYRADTSRTNGRNSGYGLGLALAKKIVEVHHGELSASSAPGQTTTFTVLLPAISKPKQAKR